MLVGLVLATAPEGLPRIELVTVDARAATFAALAGLATLLLFGVAPALSLIRTPIAPTLSGGSREGPVSSVTGQRAIVAAQLALALVLLTGASLFVETLRRLSSEPLGFDPRGVVAIATSFTGNRYGDPATMSRARMSNESFSIDMSRRRTEVIIGIEDRYGQHAAVGSREFEARFFPTGAVGRRFVYRWGTAIGLRNDYEIVGVVENVKRQEFSDDDRPAFYGFDRQGPGVNHFLLRTSEDPRRVLPVVRQTIRDVDPQLVVTGMHLMEGRVARSVAEERFRALLSVAFGATALVLAAVGLYGVIARRTADRRREFGVRIALGARPAEVGRLVLNEAIALLAAGLMAGLPAAWAAAQVSASLLFGVSSSSPLVFAAALALLAVVSLAASLIPARSASRADPVRALRP